MSVVTIFGNMEYGDEDAVQQFLLNHDQAHQEINQALVQQAGVTLDQPFLDRQPDNDWFAQHWLLHKAINEALQVGGLPGLSHDWADERSFYDWNKVNNDDHVAFAQVLGIE